jgi:hypothetical protein
MLAPWTLMVIAGVALVDRAPVSPRVARGTVAVAAAALLLVSVARVREYGDDHSRERAAHDQLGTVGAVVANCPDRGYLPSLVRDLSPSTIVVTGTSRRLRLSDWELPTGTRVAVAAGSCEESRGDFDRALAAHGLQRGRPLGPIERYDVWYADAR